LKPINLLLTARLFHSDRFIKARHLACSLGAEQFPITVPPCLMIKHRYLNFFKILLSTIVSSDGGGVITSLHKASGIPGMQNNSASYL
jgi:hypothetical protein